MSFSSSFFLIAGAGTRFSATISVGFGASFGCVSGSFRDFVASFFSGVSAFSTFTGDFCVMELGFVFSFSSSLSSSESLASYDSSFTTILLYKLVRSLF